MRSRAFTIIELLVVLSIISMLVALLLPSLRHARRAAQNSVNIQQLHQLGVFAQQYAVDHRGAYPPLFYSYATAGTLDVTIVARTREQAGITDIDVDVFRNPLDADPGHVIMQSSSGQEQLAMSYGFNINLPVGGHSGMDLPNPTRTVLFHDGSMSGAGMGGHAVSGVYPDTYAFVQHALQSRYQGVYYAVFADGHVAPFEQLTLDMLGPESALIPSSGPPSCGGQLATIYVDDDNMIVGGPGDGQPYSGNLSGGNGDIVVGTDGDDNITGGSGVETLCGGGGNDTITGGGGSDVIFGGTGDDNISGGPLDDQLYGGPGNDTITGDTGDDVIDGGDGDDALDGNGGDDTLSGGAGNDTMDGGSGKDTLVGGSGDDNMNGAGGDDVLDGGNGNDVMNGGNNNDIMTGGAGNDIMDGEGGHDTMDGGDGDDVMVGGSNNDTMTGGAGNDSLAGDAGPDTLNGGDGDDTLDGGSGNDTGDGGAGTDTATNVETVVNVP